MQPGARAELAEEVEAVNVMLSFKFGKACTSYHLEACSCGAATATTMMMM